MHGHAFKPCENASIPLSKECEHAHFESRTSSKAFPLPSCDQQMSLLMVSWKTWGFKACGKFIPLYMYSLIVSIILEVVSECP